MEAKLVFYVLMFDENVRYLVLAGDNMNDIWIWSRNKEIDRGLKDKIVSELNS